MYEHASAILAKSSSASRLFHERDLGVDARAHKSGEVDTDMKPKGKGNILVLRCIMFGWARHKQCGVSSTNNRFVCSMGSYFSCATCGKTYFPFVALRNKCKIFLL
jgi:hypothetical protein